MNMFFVFRKKVIGDFDKIRFFLILLYRNVALEIFLLLLSTISNEILYSADINKKRCVKSSLFCSSFSFNSVLKYIQCDGCEETYLLKFRFICFFRTTKLQLNPGKIQVNFFQCFITIYFSASYLYFQLIKFASQSVIIQMIVSFCCLRITVSHELSCSLL